MKIIVTDGYVENPGDLSWAPLEALGEVTYYDRIDTADEDESIRRIGDAEIAVINKAKVSRKVIDNCPNLKFIAVMATTWWTWFTPRKRASPCATCPTTAAIPSANSPSP